MCPHCSSSPPSNSPHPPQGSGREPVDEVAQVQDERDIPADSSPPGVAVTDVRESDIPADPSPPGVVVTDVRESGNVAQVVREPSVGFVEDEEILERDLLAYGDHDYLGQNLHDMDTQDPPQMGLPSLETVHRTHIPTSVHVPKTARSSWAQVLAATIWEVVNNWESTDCWIQFLILSRCILPARPKGQVSAPQGKEVLDRIRRWKAGERDLLWNESVARMRKSGNVRNSRKSPQQKSQSEVNAARSSRLIQEGQYTRAAQALTSRGIDQQSEAAKQAMLDKHPQGPPAHPPQEEISTPPLKVSVSQAKKAILSFKAGSAPG